MNLSLVNNLIASHKEKGGNASVLFDLLKERISPELLSSDEAGMWPEFMFFELDYLLYKKWMIEHLISEPVIDIGSQYGFQSEIFKDTGYTGIELHHYDFFNKNLKNVSYIHGQFPNVDINCENKIVISNMSLGWFHKDTFPISEWIHHLSKSKILFIKTTNEMHNALSSKFNFCEVLSEHETIPGISTEKFKVSVMRNGL